jgi:hypothetical protein
MSDRLRELLIKSIRQLDQSEQDEVLGELLADSGAPWAVAIEEPLTRELGAVRQRFLPHPHLFDRRAVTERVSAIVGEGGDLRMLPVRLPTADYERLRAWSKEHGFSMAVIIRTLVERFLDGQAAGPAQGVR